MINQSSTIEHTLNPVTMAAALQDSTPDIGLVTPAALAMRLQTTLELERMLEIFSQAIAAIVPHDGMVYNSEEEGLYISKGRISRHNCSYRLCLQDESLGEMNFLRGRKFRESELTQIEYFLSVLAYPVRNALMYRRALLAAQTDPLTGLYNRMAMDGLVNKELARFRRGGDPAALIVIDLDHFKHVNDTYGHLAGDNVLRSVALALQQETRKGDTVFRYGGEEFVILLPNTSSELALHAAERFCQAVRDCKITLNDGTVLDISASVGVTTSELHDSSMDLFQRADSAMYAAKTGGRDQVRLAEKQTN